jgi:hypothetical protein
MSVLSLGVSLLAVDDSKVTPGILGFLVVFALGVATWVLIRSMMRHLRKVDFDDGSTPTGGPDGATTDGGSDPAAAPGSPGDQPLR